MAPPRSAEVLSPEISAIDRAIAIGALMGEEESMVGMGIVAGNAMNRSGSPGAYLAQSGRLGDIFSAPHKSADVVTRAFDGTPLPDLNPGKDPARQYSTTFSPQEAPKAGTKNAYEAFTLGVLAALGKPTEMGAYASRYGRAVTALEVATRARAVGIDLAFGASFYGTKGQAAAKAGVGKNPGTFDKHSTGPFAKGTAPPNSRDHAARFAAIAQMVGVAIPQQFRGDISKFASPAQIALTASTLQMQARDATRRAGFETFLGFTDIDDDGTLGGMRTGLSRAVDVPNVDPVARGINSRPGPGFSDLPGSLMTGEPWSETAYSGRTTDFSRTALDAPSETSGLGRFDGSTTEVGYRAGTALNDLDTPSEMVGRFDTDDDLDFGFGDEEDDEFSSAFDQFSARSVFDAPGGGVFDWGAEESAAGLADGNVPGGMGEQTAGDGGALGTEASADAGGAYHDGNVPGDPMGSAADYGYGGSDASADNGGGGSADAAGGGTGGGSNAAGGQSSTDNSPDDRGGHSGGSAGGGYSGNVGQDSPREGSGVGPGGGSGYGSVGDGYGSAGDASANGGYY